jgi:hypothetical protein
VCDAKTFKQPIYDKAITMLLMGSVSHILLNRSLYKVTPHHTAQVHCTSNQGPQSKEVKYRSNQTCHVVVQHFNLRAHTQSSWRNHTCGLVHLAFQPQGSTTFISHQMHLPPVLTNQQYFSLVTNRHQQLSQLYISVLGSP